MIARQAVTLFWQKNWNKKWRFCANTKCNLGDNTTSKSRGIKVICDDRGGRISAMTPSLMCNVGGDNTSRRSRQVMIPPSLDHQPPSSCSRRWHNPPLRSESLKIKTRGEDPLKTCALYKARHHKMGHSMHGEPCLPLAPACKGLIGVPASIRQPELLYHP